MKMKKPVGDSLFATSHEDYFPADDSMALTRSFIYTGSNSKGVKKIHHNNMNDITGNKVNVGAFEVDVLWLYILGALIIIGVTVGGIICCC
tara:strand:+ start:217 stop:489 length:273 start_codon:yes stop_codon:yes gene_type:complete